MADIIQFNLGVYLTNCWLVKNNNEAILIDCGGNPEKINSFLEKENCRLKAIFLTHGHADHILGVPGVQEKNPCSVYIHADDKRCIEDPIYNLSEDICGKAVAPDIKNIHYIKEGDVLEGAELKYKVIHTPGHTAGSVCFDTGEFLFSGDTLFARSIGRTDFIGSSEIDMRQSLKKINKIEGERRVCPGHGSVTTLSSEKASNPYLVVLKDE